MIDIYIMIYLHFKCFTAMFFSIALLNHVFVHSYVLLIFYHTISLYNRIVWLLESFTPS